MANPLRQFGDEPTIIEDDDQQVVIPSPKQQVVNRFKAADMADRGIPAYQNEHGDITELRGPDGGPLNALDSTHNIAYDASGQPQQIVPTRTGPPQVRDAFANIPPVVDPKTGAIEQSGPGGIYNYLGQDPAVTSAVTQQAKDKALEKESSLLGRKLTLDERDLVSGTKEHKAVTADLQAQVPTLLDPKYAGAGKEDVEKAIEEHFNAEYGAPEANATSGVFGKELTPEAQALRTDIDQRKAKAIQTAEGLYGIKDRMKELSDTVGAGKTAQRDAVETLLAHAQGKTGPLDEAAMVKASHEAVPQLYPPEKDWGRMLGGAEAVNKIKGGEDQTKPGVAPVTGRIDTDEAIKQAKEGNKTYGVGDDDQVHFKPETLYSGLYHATRDGLIDPKWADEHRAEFKLAQDKYNDLVEAAGSAQVLKALIHGGGRGAIFLASAVPGAELGGLALAETGPVGAGIGAALGGLITGTTGLFLANKGIEKLAEYSSAVKALTASAELHPVASGVGELLAFGASAPRALTNLYKLSTIAGEAVADLGPTAVRTAQLKVVGRQLGIGAVTGAGFTGLRAAFDAGRYIAADALGIKHEDFQSPTVNEYVTNAALAFLTASHSIQFKNYTGAEVASIMFRAKLRKNTGVAMDAEAGPEIIKTAAAAGMNFDSTQSAAMTKPLTKQEISVWEGLRDKTERLQRSGAFDDATGVKFTGAKQAQVSAFGKEGAPIVSAGVEAVKGEGGGGSGGKGPKTPELPGKSPEKPANARVVEPEAPVSETSRGTEPVPGKSEAPISETSRKPVTTTEPVAPAPKVSPTAAPAPQSVDAAAHQAATSPKNDLSEPTQAQKEAGNYTKGHQVVAGLDISFENPAGSRRKPEFRPLGSHYGYIKGTVGADKDHVDAFVKPGTPTDYNGPIFVVNQHNRDGKFDEHKAIIGVDTPEAAKAEYLKNYQEGWTGGKSVAEFPNPKAFKKWVTSGKKGTPAKTSKLVGPVLVDAAGNPIAKGNLKQTHKDLADVLIKDPTTSPEMLDAAIEAGTNDKLHRFIDKKGNIVDRKQAARIALANDQAPAGTTTLQSQDLIKHATAKEKKVVDLAKGALAPHRTILKSLGHPEDLAIGKVNHHSGVVTIETKDGPRITIDPEKMIRSTSHLSEREKLKIIQRGIEEEVLHVASLTWEAKSPENKALLEAWGKEKDELDAHMAKAYAGWENLDAWAKAHEKLRAVLQKRWTGRLTEAAYRALQSFLKYLRGIYEKLTPGQQKIVNEVEAMMKGESREVAPKTKAVEGSKAVKTREAAPKPIALPEGWKGVVGKTRTKEGHTYEAEVDWPNKRIVFSKDEHMRNPKIWNHEAAHVVIEHSLPEAQRLALYEEYNQLKNFTTDQDKYWAHEQIAMDAGNYLTDPASVEPALKALFDRYIPGGQPNATTTGKQSGSEEGELSRVPPREDVPENAPEVRSGNGKQAAGGGGAIERPATPEKPVVRKPAKTSKLDKATQDELKDAFKGLFMASPELTPLSEMEKSALAALRKAQASGKLGQAGEKQLRRLEDRIQSQGDLGLNEAFSLTAETAMDTEAIQAQLDQAVENKKTFDQQQGSLFAAAPSRQLGIPPDKLIPFMQLAQKMVEQGIDTPGKLADELSAIDARTIPYSQALWDAIGQVKPELRGTHDWTQFYDKPEAPTRKMRASAPDGGFTEHPLIRAIIDDMGGILSKTAARKSKGEEWFEANKSLWDGAPHLADPRHSKIYDPKSGQTPDLIASGLSDMGLLKDGDVEELWRQVELVSRSSKSIERQERDQARNEKDYVEPEIDDPWADETPAEKPPLVPGTEVFRNDEGFFDVRVVPREDGQFAVTLVDDSGDVFPRVEIYEDKTLAIRRAKSLAGIEDDTDSGIDLEPDSSGATPAEQGGPDSLQTGPGATGGDEPVSSDVARGSSDPATSGPLSSDVPSAPHRAPSDQLFPEPASEPSERPSGSVEPQGSRQPSDGGTPPDTSGTIIPGENLIVPTDSQDVGSVSQSGSAELAEIKRAAPALTDEQAGDVAFIEARLQGQGKPGVLLTNGTGTGKTFSGLGAVQMMLNRGAKHILVAAPSDKIGSDWVHTAKTFFGIEDIAQLPDTNSNGAGNRVVVTTYANFGQNDQLVKRPWDMIVTDEAHYLSSSEEGGDTLALDALRALTFHPEGNLRRVTMLEPDATLELQRIRSIEKSTKGQLSEENKTRRAENQKKIDDRMAQVRESQAGMVIKDRPKVVMLSATPFAYRKNVAYANGYLFDYPAVEQRGYNTPSPFGQFMIENFGYRMRTGRLTEPENAVATGILERRFAERLMREKAMRGRALVVPFDYSRDFVLTESQLGKKIDDIISKMMSDERLRHLEKHIGVSDYLQRRFILESLKAREAIDRIRKHVALGRKVVVFHDYKLGGAQNPLSPNYPPGGSVFSQKHGNLSYDNLFSELKSNFPDWDETAAALNNLKSPIQYFMRAFTGDGELGIFNGSVPKRQRRELVAAFNQKGGKMKVMLAQRASAKEGISLHDIFGDEQRVFLDLGIPGRPTDAIQSEGRIYRHGVKSNAVDEYLVTGTNFERWTFAQTIAQRASTAENLAMGEGARALLQSFSTGFNEAGLLEPHLDQGTGGKEADAVRERGDPYKNAVALYYTNEKKTSRSKSREGIDYFPTPEPIGFKMVEWAALQPGEKFLEPSAGHGAIARFAPDSTTRHAVEPSNELAGRLALNAPDTEIHNQRFEDFNIVNKFDGIAMNSPYGHAGKTAMEHLIKATGHLRDGGRVVALIPRGQMDERFNDWMDSKQSDGFQLRVDINLPAVAFERAGTSVSTRIVVIDKTDGPGLENVGTRDLSQIDDIKELFERLEHMSVPSRPEKKVVEPGPNEVEIEAKPPAAPQSAGYVPDPDAARKPLSPEPPAQPKPTRDSTFTPAEFLHTKTRVPIYVAKTARFLTKLEFNNARVRAKYLGGHYSSYKVNGAIPGFHFVSAALRDSFISDTEERSLGAARPIKAVAAFYKENVESVAKEIGLTAKESFILLRKLVSPTTGVAMQAHDQVMKMLATRNQKAYETDRVLEESRKMFDDLARPDQVDFIDRMKTGQQQVTPELQQVADVMRKIDTESWQEAVNAYSALGFKANEIPLSWLDNHYRVLWKKIPGQNAAQQAEWIGRARRGLRGSMGQHKQHTLDDMSQGLQMGGVPYSYNPVVMFKLAQADLWKLTSTLRTWKWGKDNGFVKYVRGAFPKAPDGMVPLDDSIANVYFPAASGEGLVAGGKYFVEEGFGRLLNNYLSRDYIRQARLGRGLLYIKNVTTSIELSLSLFHGVFETMETIGSSVGLGLSRLFNRGVGAALKGDLHPAVSAIREMMGAGLTPLTVNNLGAQIRRAAADPTAFFQTPDGLAMLKKYPRAREMIDDLFQGGWKPNELEQDWKNNSVRTFIEALSDLKSGASDNYVGAGIRAFPAVNEMLMKPLFDYYIPNLKVGQFFKEYAEALEQHADRLANGDISRATLARDVWHFIENRFGETNFDSLFWNANFKTAMQLLFRSVTWKLGSVEAFAGAFGGQAKEFKDAFTERRAPELHRNTAWLFGMLLLTGTLGYIMSKVLAGKDPKDLKDFVFPQIDPKDDKVRVSLPTYFKDAVHLWHSPTNFITASMSGWIGRVMDLLRNKDYFGVQIRDTDDPITKQMLQVGKFTGETMLPFSVRGYRNLSAQDVSTMRKFLAVVGVNPAPRYIGQSAAERKSEEYWKNQQTVGGVKPEKFESKMAQRQIVAKIRHGESPDISGALAKGDIKPKDVKPIYQRAQMGALASQVLHMPLDEAERVYALAKPSEKIQLTAIMAKKRANAARAGKKIFQGF